MGKVIIADMSPFNRVMVTKALHELGFYPHDLIELTNGVDVVNLVAKMQASNEEIDLIIVDKDVDGMHGYHVINHCRSAGLTAPIVLTIQSPQKEHVVLAIKVGASQCITRPFTVPDVKARLKSLLGITDEAEEEFKRTRILKDKEQKVDLNSDRIVLADVIEEITVQY